MMIIGGHSVTVNVRFHLFSDLIVKTFERHNRYQGVAKLPSPYKEF